MHANDRQIGVKALDELVIPDLPLRDDDDDDENDNDKENDDLEEVAGANSASNLSPGNRKLRLYFREILDSRISPDDREDHESRKACDIGMRLYDDDDDIIIVVCMGLL
jgi:hypothetical protein